MRGHIKWFNHSKGFGFVTPLDGSQDAFLHKGELSIADLSTIKDGDEVEFEIMPGQMGPAAVDVRLVSGSGGSIKDQAESAGLGERDILASFGQAFDSAGVSAGRCESIDEDADGLSEEYDGDEDEDEYEAEVKLEHLALFVIDQREVGGSLWVGGPAADEDVLKALFGPAEWLFVSKAYELGGEDGFRLAASQKAPLRTFLKSGGAKGDGKAADSRPIIRKARRSSTAMADFMACLVPSPALAKIVGSEPLPRTEVVKRLWSYIKRHDLQDRVNRRAINADALLLPVFNGRKQVSMFDMTKLVSKHLS